RRSSSGRVAAAATANAPPPCPPCRDRSFRERRVPRRVMVSAAGGVADRAEHGKALPDDGIGVSIAQPQPLRQLEGLGRELPCFCSVSQARLGLDEKRLEKEAIRRLLPPQFLEDADSLPQSGPGLFQPPGSADY